MRARPHLVVAILAFGGGGCFSGSNTTEAAAALTLVTVEPSRFRGDVACGALPGSLRRYTATLIDLAGAPEDASAPFVLPTSDPVPCAMRVSFGNVVPGHRYVARIAGWDRDDLTAFGGPGSGSPKLVDGAGAVVPPRWTASCGEVEPGADPADAGADDAADRGDAGEGVSAAPGPTEAVFANEVLVHSCTVLASAAPAGDTTVVVDPSGALGALACGGAPGSVARFVVTPDGAAPVEVACGEVATFPAMGGEVASFTLDAYESGAAAPRWGATCSGAAFAHATTRASCAPLSDQGTIVVPVPAALASAGRACSAADLAAVTLRIQGSSAAPATVACDRDAAVGPLAPGAWSIALDATSAAGAFAATCAAEVAPGRVAIARCTP